MKLKNLRHERFCQEYVKDHNGSEAYKRAGYRIKGNVSRVNASRLLTNANIQNRIAELEEKIRERNEIETDEIFEGYKKIINICGKTYKTKKGKTNIDVMVDAKNVKGALDSLARMEGRFTNKTKQTEPLEVIIRNYTDES